MGINEDYGDVVQDMASYMYTVIAARMKLKGECITLEPVTLQYTQRTYNPSEVLHIHRAPKSASQEIVIFFGAVSGVVFGNVTVNTPLSIAALMSSL